jgi:hypothetical protein
MIRKELAPEADFGGEPAFAPGTGIARGKSTFAE